MSALQWGVLTVGLHEGWRPRAEGGLQAQGVKSDKGLRTSRGHGGPPPRSDVAPREYGDRSVLDTLVVRTVNNGCRAVVFTAVLAYAEHLAWGAAARPGT